MTVDRAEGDVSVVATKAASTICRLCGQWTVRRGGKLRHLQAKMANLGGFHQPPECHATPNGDTHKHLGVDWSGPCGYCGAPEGAGCRTLPKEGE